MFLNVVIPGLIRNPEMRNQEAHEGPRRNNQFSGPQNQEEARYTNIEIRNTASKTAKCADYAKRTARNNSPFQGQEIHPDAEDTEELGPVVNNPSSLPRAA